MLFNSSHFLIFFPIVVACYYALSHRWRWLLLLVASYYFYMSWNPWYISLIAGSTLVDYWAGRMMERASDKKHRRPWLWLSLAANLGLLLTFKYFNFFLENINDLTGADLKYSQLLLPVGISFYTFQTLSYTIDVYNGKIPVERNLGRFALFVSFFPQLVAGPIERASHLLPQFRQKVSALPANFSEGSKRIVWGLFKKVVIADNLGLIVDPIYSNPEGNGGLALLVATYCFTFQIYCDFSGYSDIAIGTARILGFDLMENFKVPYLSRSIREFWSRWHISLSTWFRDYVYIPLGGNRVGPVRWYLNLVIVFVVSGFWHGAAWTFVIWGALHGIYLMTENWLAGRGHNNQKERKATLPRWIKIVVTFHLVVLGWIFFRANSVADAWFVIEKVVTLNWEPDQFMTMVYSKGIGWFAMKLVMLAAFILLDSFITKLTIGGLKKPLIFKQVTYGLLLALIVIFGNWGEVAFIYFQF